MNFKSESIEPVFIHKGLYYDKVDDIGNTYREIDLTRQHMWLYKDGIKSEGKVYVDGILYGEDLKPANWNLLNGEPITEAIELKDKDLIESPRPKVVSLLI